MHSQIEKHLCYRNFHQGGEIHEHAEDNANDISRNGIFTGESLNPLRLDHFPDDPYCEDPDEQEWEDLFYEAPGFPEHIANFFL